MEGTPSECNLLPAAASSSFVDEEYAEKHGRFLAEFSINLKPSSSRSETADAADHKKPLEGLLVPNLPCDAWEKWCKDGVLCFGLAGDDVLKIYFGNTRDLSIYHVIDFSFSKFGMDRIASTKTVCYTLVGSKIYVLGGSYNSWNTARRVDVHFCDVANQSLDADGCYEWKDGPKLNTHKHNPLVFSLEGSIYSLCVGFYDSKSECTPFEVLKPDSDKWEVLNTTPSFSERRKVSSVIGSFVYEDAKKILIFAMCWKGQILFIYDAGLDSWTQVEYSFNNYNLPGISGSFRFDSVHPYLLNNLLNHLGVETVEHGILNPLCLDASTLLFVGDGGNYPDAWHLLPLERGKRFCLLAIYSEINHGYHVYDRQRCYARFGTFDLVEFPSVWNTCNAKRLKLGGYKVGNRQFKQMDFAYGLGLIPRVPSLKMK